MDVVVMLFPDECRIDVYVNIACATLAC